MVANDPWSTLPGAMTHARPALASGSAT